MCEHCDPLKSALANLLDHVISGQAYKSGNPYLRSSVQEGLRTLGHATGFSTFGHDWMDVLDKFKEQHDQRDDSNLSQTLSNDTGSDGA